MLKHGFVHIPGSRKEEAAAPECEPLAARQLVPAGRYASYPTRRRRAHSARATLCALATLAPFASLAALAALTAFAALAAC